LGCPISDPCGTCRRDNAYVVTLELPIGQLNATSGRIKPTQAEVARLGSLRVVARCGHYVPLEKPEELNAILSSAIASEDRCVPIAEPPKR